MLIIINKAKLYKNIMVKKTTGAKKVAPKTKSSETSGYCVKCRTKREMVSVKEVKMKGGRRANQGKCPKCSTKMFRILGKKKD